ncbi:MAG: DUF11 domain-containing protein [Nitrospirae bacterium]|nr:DUF11 domain-containing protein [Nitrospirota bacterium]
MNKCKTYKNLLKLVIFSVIASACLLYHTDTAHAYGPTDCAGPRFGSNLGCTANDVSITGIAVVGGPSSCTGGSNITVDLDVTVNSGTPNRWDIGIFISNDGKDPQLTPASGGAANCSVAILPTTDPPFRNLDPGPWSGITDTCGDVNGSMNDPAEGKPGPKGTGVLRMTNVTINCQAYNGPLGSSGGNLFIPFVVSWDNQSSPAGATCTSIADPVPNTTSKCNAPLVAQGTVSVVVLPAITNTDNITIINPGDTVNYIVVITNTTGDTINNSVFKDPAVTYLTANSVSCTAGGGATCPAGPTVGAMQGAGLTIPSLPNNSNVTFSINATLAINAPAGELLTNTASVTVSSQTNSASDTDTISSIPVGVISISPSSSSKNTVTPSSVVFNYTIYNQASSPPSDTISLSATSSQGWTVLLSTSSITVNANGSATFTLTVQVPSGITAGTLDTTTITAISGNNPGNTATATAITTVSNPITIIPNNIASGGKGSSAYYDHTVQNNTSTTQTVNLSTSFSGSCTGWTATIYKSDRVTSITSVTLDPYGSSGDLDKDIVVKVNIPASAATGSICTVTVTATAGSDTASATDETTVKDLVLYSDSGHTDESYIFPAGNIVYAKAFGLATTGNKKYYFKWYDSSNTLKETSPSNNPDANKQLPDSYSILTSELNFGTWRVEVWLDETTDVKMLETNFYVGPDHVSASYTGANPSINTDVTINLSLHDRYNHDVPLDPAYLSPNIRVVRGNPPATKDPLKITVTVSGSATIVSTTLTGAVITGQTVTGILNSAIGSTTGTATITITDSVREIVTITATTYNSALYGSPARDEFAEVRFVLRRMRILKWREVQ